ncbi:MAG TPA: YCF48-related protein [bacterium]|jgi:photosystem II stability/assembly factor-like uncharacterized protein
MVRFLFLAAVGLAGLMVLVGCSSTEDGVTTPGGGSRFSPQPWMWQNPTPQGNDLTDVTFVDARHGWGVGACGTILQTADGGQTWAPQVSGTDEDLVSVSFADLYHGWVTGQNGTLLYSGNGRDWSRQTIEHDSKQAVKDVCARGPAEAWAVSGDRILHTTDGAFWWGVSQWDNTHLNAITFVGDSLGWVVGYRDTRSMACGVILQTTNGGETWVERPNGPCDDLSDVSFVDAYHGWTVGQRSGRIFPTTDGGQTWVEHRFSYDAYASKVVFKDMNVGWVSSGPYDEYPEYYRFNEGTWRTNDGGVTWSQLAHGARAMCFLDMNMGWMVGWGGSVYRTTNGGFSMEQQIQTVTTSALRDVVFSGSENGWAVGDSGSILHTTDGGQHWLAQDAGTMTDLYALAFVSGTAGFAVGGTSNYSATILRTEDGGASWTEQVFGGIGYLSDVQFLDSRTGWAAGYYGAMLHTSDGGQTWVIQNTGGTTNFQAVYFASPTNGWAIGYTGSDYSYYGTPVMLRTTNGGESWQPKSFGGLHSPQDVTFSDANHGYVVGYNGLIVRTTDGGDHWLAVESSTTLPLNKVVFPSREVGWAIGSDGAILYTADAGITWNTMESGTRNELNGAYFTAPDRGWVVGEKGTILSQEAPTAVTNR